MVQYKDPVSVSRALDIEAGHATHLAYRLQSWKSFYTCLILLASISFAYFTGQVTAWEIK